MPNIGIGAKVTINMNNIDGEVIGIWQTRSETIYQIQYPLSTGEIAQTWLYYDEDFKLKK